MRFISEGVQTFEVMIRSPRYAKKEAGMGRIERSEATAPKASSRLRFVPHAGFAIKNAYQPPRGVIVSSSNCGGKNCMDRHNEMIEDGTSGVGTRTEIDSLDGS